MALSKSQRILILLVIDAAFFFLELIIGYAVHSLALVADAFHMLNDVLSLCVGLWAVRVAQSGSTNTYTYGWQRAETLGALVNGVFLVALCVTIFLEAIQRFVEKPNVSNPKLVLIVGCLGLVSNILGLVLFHDHGHSHGNEASEAEEGHSHSHATETSPLMHKNSANHSHSPNFTGSDEEDTTISANSTSSPVRKTISGGDQSSRHRRRTSGFGFGDDIPTHPASLRGNVILAARYQDEPREEEEDAIEEVTENDHEHGHAPHSHSNGKASYGATNTRAPNAHKDHIHNQPREQTSGGGGGHGHSHGDLNMRGVFLHVMGDALGNIGVIATALIIWLTKFEGRFYFDPAISLVITAIILASAIPLCKAASRILLQAVPMGLSVDEIKADIVSLPQVKEVHHLHVWQLSDTKLIASLHVKVDCEVEGSGSADYMKLAREIRACLHGYGIHSSTIQPEFVKKVSNSDSDSDENGLLKPADLVGNSANGAPTGQASKAGSLLSADGHTAGPGCMMDCDDSCGTESQCCPTTDVKGQK